MIEVHHLHYILAAAELGSFSKAANAIGIKQSTLSQRIRDLEIRLGVTLFARSTRGAHPTLAGQRFLEGARGIVSDLDDMQCEAKALGRGTAGRVAIGFGCSLSAGNLRAIIRDFSDRDPHIRLSLVEAEQSALLHKLDRNVLDVVVLPGYHRHEGHRSRVFWSEQLLIAMPDHHRLSVHQQLHWNDISDATIVLTDDDHGRRIRDVLIGHFGKANCPVLDGQHLSRENMLQLLDGERVSIICESSRAAVPSHVVLREIHDASGPALLTFALFWNENNDNPALARFLAFIARRHGLPDSGV